MTSIPMPTTSAPNTADPTDWLPTSLPSFAPLETSLRCAVCKEFFDTPMITSCSHSFCSLCIRRCLSAEGRCPACRASEQASKLRRNWALEEAVAAFKGAREGALGLARRVVTEGEGDGVEGGRRKRRRIDGGREVDTGDQVEGRTTRSRSKRTAASQPSQQEAIVVEDSDIMDEDEDFAPVHEEEEELDDGLVSCPICQQRMPVSKVDPHIQRGCPDESDKKPIHPIQQRAPARTHTPTQPGHIDRLPELNYSLLKDTALKKKLQELGIPAWGGRQLLIRRHTEWVNLWNSNSDSSYPKTKRELLRELELWESSQGGGSREGSSSVMRKDFDADGWKTANGDHFSRLIADARRKKKISAPTETGEKGKKEEEHKQSVSTEPVATNGASSQVPQPEPQQATQTTPHPEHPYDHNPAALSSIRHKVAAANRGEDPVPLMNAGFRSPTHTHPHDHDHDPTARPITTDSRPQNAALLSAARFGAPVHAHAHTNAHDGDGEEGGRERVEDGAACDLPGHFRSGGETRKMPMFRVPEEPIVDVDLEGTTTG